MNLTDPTDILFQGAETYEKKNEDYGDSWRLVGEILYRLAGQEPITLETTRDFVSFGLYNRRFDKIARAFQGEFVADGEMNYESIEDAHEDESVYAAMHAANQADRLIEEAEKVAEEFDHDPSSASVGIKHFTTTAELVEEDGGD